MGAVLIGMLGPVLAKGINYLFQQITPLYILLVTGILSISLFITAFYRVIIFINREKITKQFLTPYLFLIGMIASGVVSYTIVFIIINW